MLPYIHPTPNSRRVPSHRRKTTLAYVRVCVCVCVRYKRRVEKIYNNKIAVHTYTVAAGENAVAGVCVCVGTCGVYACNTIRLVQCVSYLRLMRVTQSVVFFFVLFFVLRNEILFILPLTCKLSGWISSKNEKINNEKKNKESKRKRKNYISQNAYEPYYSIRI